MCKENEKNPVCRPKLADEELTERLAALQNILIERGCDFLIVISEKVSQDQLGKMLPHEALSCISSKSEVPVLPSAVVSVASRSQDHMNFIRDLFDLVSRMARNGNRGPKEPSGNPSSYVN